MKLFIFVGLIVMATATDVDSILKAGNDQFTAKLFNEVVNLPENADKSVILSAFSVLPPLAQLALASVGESHDEILKAIGFANDNVTKEVFTSINAKLRAVKGVELKMANRVYIAKDAALNPTFASFSRDVFNSDVKNVDFGQNEDTAKSINTWVEEQTNSKIKDLIHPSNLDGTTRAVLVNALYFKGSWKSKFNVNATRDGDFHVTKDKTVKVPMMHQTADYRYAESAELDAKLLEMNYDGDSASFLIVLPNKVDGLKELQVKLKDPAALTKAVDLMNNFEVDVWLPRFKIETKTNLKEVLQKMQITNMFDANKAKLNNLLSKESNLFISDAIQKAFIEVNEDGAEAAAANDLTVIKLAMVPKNPQIFKAEHPFYYELRFGVQKLFNGLYIS